MALSRLHSVAIVGLEAVPVEIEVDISHTESQHLVIVGLPDTAVRESKDRVTAAIKNSGIQISGYFCTVNLAPGDLKKEGTLYDLPIALGMLYSMKKFQENTSLSDYLIIGELSLSGETRPIRGALAMTLLARKMGKKGVLIPQDNAHEAAAVPGVAVIPIRSLSEAVSFLKDPTKIPPASIDLSRSKPHEASPHVDFADIKGQEHAKRALEIAAAGGHNVIMSGPPGSGKTMLAKALISIMPEMSVDEILETTKIHSIAGLLKNGQYIVTQRPFRSPHHTVSYAGLIGGGSTPKPGEVSLAHNGILFLDELPEFSRTVLEVLRQPLEDKSVTISRANGHFTFPTNFIFIAAMNPCPCGMLGHPTKPCKDSQLQIDRYNNKISGPLKDRIDLHIEVPAVSSEELSQAPSGETSEEIRQRVFLARSRQLRRAGKTNAMMSARELNEYVPINQEISRVLSYAINTMGLSARACDRLRRVARSIADLEGEELVSGEHFMEAIHFRQLEKEILA